MDVPGYLRLEEVVGSYQLVDGDSSTGAEGTPVFNEIKSEFSVVRDEVYLQSGTSSDNCDLPAKPSFRCCRL
jgi:hypothetical protein